MVFFSFFCRDVLDHIAHVKVSGLTDAFEKYKEDIKQASTPPKVRVVFEMSTSGLLSVPEAYVNIELPDNGKSFTGKKKKQNWGLCRNASYLNIIFLDFR